MLPSIEQRLAIELAAKPVQVAAAIALLDEGATVPFIARYRKEATGGLDDIQLRLLEERLRYLRELEDRRAAIIASITEQNKMTPALLRRHRPWPKTRPASKTCTCRTSRSAAPRPRSRSKRAWRRWPTRLLADPTLNPGDGSRQVPARSIHHRRRQQPGRARHQGGARRRAPDPDGALRRRRDPAAVAARIRAGARRGRIESGRGQAGRRREVRRLLRLLRNHLHRAVAPRAGAAARPPRRHAGRDAAPRHRSRKAEVGRAAQSVRRPHRRALRHQEPGPPGRQVAGRHRALDLAREELHAPRDRADGRAAREGRAGRDQRVRAQPEGAAAGRAGRPARHHGPRPGPAHRRQGGGGRRHRQGGRHRRHLPAPAEERLGRLAARAGRAGREAQCVADLDRQRHRLARNRQAGAGPDQAARRN